LYIYQPLSVYEAAMDFVPDEDDQTLEDHIFFGLSREELIGPGFAVGLPDVLRQTFPLIEGDGSAIIACP
jgi:hypothetical protein